MVGVAMKELSMLALLVCVAVFGCYECSRAMDCEAHGGVMVRRSASLSMSAFRNVCIKREAME